MRVDLDAWREMRARRTAGVRCSPPVSRAVVASTSGSSHVTPALVDRAQRASKPERLRCLGLRLLEVGWRDARDPDTRN